MKTPRRRIPTHSVSYGRDSRNSQNPGCPKNPKNPKNPPDRLLNAREIRERQELQNEISIPILLNGEEIGRIRKYPGSNRLEYQIESRKLGELLVPSVPAWRIQAGMPEGRTTLAQGEDLGEVSGKGQGVLVSILEDGWRQASGEKSRAQAHLDSQLAKNPQKVLDSLVKFLQKNRRESRNPRDSSEIARNLSQTILDSLSPEDRDCFLAREFSKNI